MSIRAALAAMLLSSAAPAQQADDPLLRPIAPKSAAKWLGPEAPIRVFGNFYLVGFEGLNVGLIDTGAGLILIDGAVPQGVRAIEANIRKLGFRVEDVKYILSTEPHYDHAGGIAALARDSGATVVAGAAAATVLRGGTDPSDAQASWLVPFPAVSRLRTVRDGERLRLGGVTVNARATPGHTRGSTSWTWRSCEGRQCRTIVFAASLNPAAPPAYRFSDPDHGWLVASFGRSFAAMRRMPCDILITAHPSQSGGAEKRRRFDQGSKPNPYIDPGACRAYAQDFAAALDKRLAQERAPQAK
ncbi:subclass B3 metallo-beta-lactamase [Sphingomonas sp. Root241]|uniref:subclass B3 metallo-beta-lactamase n=1 Tax=Sphingomonas sp. Root241 TaxID=1736501 RepID=UPI0006FF32AE|nr:subclass B3 metallo-beta-lactamase [Sphingomonas sp. Root241]KRC82509.1 subclass B3 metallo-beta-lactamase [Sphingomonas sp. Root241]